MGNTQSDVQYREKYPHHLILSQDEIAEEHKRESKVSVSERRRKYYCGENFVPSSRIHYWELDTIKSMFISLPLIKTQLRMQLRNIRSEEQRKDREKQWVNALRVEIDAITQDGGEYAHYRDAMLKLDPLRQFGVLALANFNVTRAARCLATEICAAEDNKAFLQKVIAFHETLPSTPEIPVPNYNQINALLRGDSRTEAQSMAVWKQMIAMMTRTHEQHGVVMPFNQCYKLLRSGGYNVDTAYAYYKKDVQTYRQLKPILLAKHHNNERADYDCECAHTMLRRCDFSVEDAVEMYGAEMKRRHRAVQELRSELIAARFSNIVDDRCLYFHLISCFWDLGWAKDCYNPETVLQKASNSQHANSSASSNADANNTSDNMVYSSVDQENYEDDCGLERDQILVSGDQGLSSSEEAVVNEKKRRALFQRLLDDDEERDEPILPLGAPFEPQTESNKLISVMHVTPELIEGDAILVFVPVNEPNHPRVQRQIQRGGLKLEQELRCSKNIKVETPVCMLGRNLPARYVVYVQVESEEESIGIAYDAVLNMLKAKAWRYLTIVDPAETLRNIPQHRVRHILGSKTRSFMEVVSNRRSLDCIVFSSEIQEYQQCWGRTMLHYFPGPNMQNVVKERFLLAKQAEQKLLHQSQDFTVELANMTYEGDLPLPSSTTYDAGTTA